MININSNRFAIFLMLFLVGTVDPAWGMGEKIKKPLLDIPKKDLPTEEYHKQLDTEYKRKQRQLIAEKLGINQTEMDPDKKKSRIEELNKKEQQLNEEYMQKKTIPAPQPPAPTKPADVPQVAQPQDIKPPETAPAKTEPTSATDVTTQPVGLPKPVVGMPSQPEAQQPSVADKFKQQRQEAEEQAKKEAEDQKQAQAKALQKSLGGAVVENLPPEDQIKVLKQNLQTTKEDDPATKKDLLEKLIEKLPGGTEKDGYQKQLDELKKKDEGVQKEKFKPGETISSILHNPNVQKAGILALIGGGGIGGTGGITGGIFGIQLGDGESNEGGVLPPSIHEDPPANDAEYNKKLYLIANAYASVKDKFKEAIQNGNHSSPKFEINLGKVNIGSTEEEVKIVYNFEKGGAGDLDKPLSPIIIEIYPDSIDGYAITPDKLLAQIDDQEIKEIVTLLLNPLSAFIFFIKIGILINSDSSKDVVAWANSVLLEGVLLLYRLTLDKNYSGISAQSLLSYFPTWLQNYSNEIKAKMFSEMVKIYSENIQGTSATEDIVNAIRKLTDYKQQIAATEQTLFPLISTKLLYSEKLLLVHALLRLISDLGVKVPTKAEEQKAEVSSRLDLLIPVITEASELMTDASFEQRFIDKIKSALTTINAIKTGTKTASQNIARPRLSETILEVKDYSMTTIISVVMRHFYKLSTKVFLGDYGFSSNDLLLGRGETEDLMLAIWIRCMKDTAKAEKYLYETKDSTVTLKNFSTTFSIDPSKERSRLIDPASNELQEASTALTAAIKALKESKTAENTKAYKKAKETFDKSAQKYIDAQHNFTRSYSVFYPIVQNDGSSRTVANFAQREFATVRKVGLYDDKLFDMIAGKFNPILGLPRDMIWD